MIEERPKPRRSSTSHTLIQRLEDVALATGDPTVHAAVKMMVGAPEHWDDCVVYLARLQAEAKTEMFRRLQALVSRCSDATVLVRDVMPDIDLSDGQVVAMGDWQSRPPKTIHPRALRETRNERGANMEQMTFDKLAQQYYETYCRSSDNKNFRGEPCPSWDALPVAVRTHWRAVAVESQRLAVCGYLKDVCG